MPVAGLPESRRREYLAALAVPLFVARQPLPGAALSPRLPEAEPEQVVLMTAVPAVPVQMPVVEPAGRVAAVSPTAAALASLTRAPAAVAAREPAEAMPALSVPVAAALATPRFICRLLQVDACLGVLIDLGSHPGLEGPEAMLWRNICQACGWQSGEPRDFSWPLKGMDRPGSLIHAGPSAAREALHGWLLRNLAGDSRLLVFGPALADCVEHPHRLLPALAELLAQPYAKRALWQQLAGERTD